MIYNVKESKNKNMLPTSAKMWLFLKINNDENATAFNQRLKD